MSEWLRVVIIGSVIVVAFDAAASIASSWLGFPYTYATAGSWLIYFGVGYVAAGATRSVGRAALAAGIVGSIEATLGWAVSWVIGPGRPPEGSSYTLGSLVVAVPLVVAVASVIGSIAGVIRTRRPANAQ